ALVILLRYLLGIPGLCALVAVLVPWSWMAAAHRWLGLGEKPTDPVVEHLARSVSALDAFLGVWPTRPRKLTTRYGPMAKTTPAGAPRWCQGTPRRLEPPCLCRTRRLRPRTAPSPSSITTTCGRARSTEAAHRTTEFRCRPRC